MPSRDPETQWNAEEPISLHQYERRLSQERQASPGPRQQIQLPQPPPPPPPEIIKGKVILSSVWDN